MPVTTWTAGQVLAAQDLNDTFASKMDYATPTNAQSGTGASAYSFVLADASRLTTATGTSAKTFTIPPQASVAWVANTILRVANTGTGALTIAGGSGVTITNAGRTLDQFESAKVIRTGSNAWTVLPDSGLSPLGGKILQIVRATDTTQRNTTSTSYVDASISVTITPQKSDSAVLLLWFLQVRHPSADYILFRITDNANNPISGAEAGVAGSATALSNPFYSLAIAAYATPATTSATTYKGRFAAQSGGAARIANENQTGQLFAIEVSA